LKDWRVKMIDFVKVKINPSDVPNDFINHKLLNFTQAINSRTGELKKGVKRVDAEYDNLKFFLYDSGLLIVSGSIHKFFNEGYHNYNTFDIKSLNTALDKINDLFGLDLTRCILQNLEVGLNITPPINATPLVKSLLTHVAQPFKYYSIKGSDYKQTIHGRYYLKAYNKSLQYKTEDEIFRFEIKYKKMLAPNNLGIITLYDLYDSKKMRLVLELLLEKWRSVILYDPTLRLEEVSKYIRTTKIHQWQNQNWWLELSKNSRYNELKRMDKIIGLHSQNIKSEVARILNDKIKEVLYNRVPMTLEYKKYNCVLSSPSYIVKQASILSTHFNITELANKRVKIAV
jgi:hypothetical protein